jgi:hypothetical protein
MFQVVSELSIHLSQNKREVVAVFILPLGATEEAFDEVALKTSTDILRQASPMLQIKHFHVVCRTQTGKKGSFVTHALPKIMSTVQSSDCGWNAVTHVEESPEAIYRVLKSLGYPEAEIPTPIKEAYDSLSALAMLSRMSQSRSDSSDDASCGSSHPSDNSHDEEGEEGSGGKQKDFYRTRNAMYSKRNYYKKKNEFKDLQNWTFELQAQNFELNEESKRLEGLLASAKRMAAMHDAAEQEAIAFQRRVPPPQQEQPTMASMWKPSTLFNSASRPMHMPPSAGIPTYAAAPSAMNPSPQDLEDLALLHYIRRKRERQAMAAGQFVGAPMRRVEAMLPSPPPQGAVKPSPYEFLRVQQDMAAAAACPPYRLGPQARWF